MRLFCIVLISFGLLQACAYRFTNRHIAPPTNIRSIAFESVYDTSREVLSHEILWEKLQYAFTSDGRIRVASQKDADALLRVHIVSGSVTPTRDLTVGFADKDPDVFEERMPPPPPEKFRVLPEAGEYTTRDCLSVNVVVEVWNLKTKALLMRKNYPVAENFLSLNKTTSANQFLRYEEAQDTSMMQISEKIASAVVRDLLVSI